MAFNLTSLSKTRRNFARGEPPPRGSLEYVGVGDMFAPSPPRPAPAAPPPRAAAPAPAAPAPAAPQPAGVGRLVAAGLACAGVALAATLLTRRRDEDDQKPRVAVPDAYPEE
jgi:hypothetical protein